MTYAVARDTRPEWVDALVLGCRAEGVPYRLVDMARDDWRTQLEGCEVLLWRAHMGDPVGLREAWSKLPLCETMGVRCFPSAHMLWLYDDKVRQAWFFRQHGVPTPETFVSRDLRESHEFVDQAPLPLVFKAAGGASSNGVYLVRTRQEARRLVTLVLEPRRRESGRASAARFANAFATQARRSVERRLGRSRSPRRITRFDVDRQNIDWVYFQQFVNDDGDWRITTFGRDTISVFRRLNRPGDFRASGSGRWTKPEVSQLPAEACDYALKFSQEQRFSCMAYDVFVQDEGFVIGEISYTILLNEIYSNTLFRRKADGSYESVEPIPITTLHIRAMREAST